MDKSTKKILLLLCGSVAIIASYITFLPFVSSGYDIGASIHFSMILYPLIAVCALYNLDPKAIAKKHIATACLLGGLTLAVCLPIVNGRIDFLLPYFNMPTVILINVIIGGTVALAYLWSIGLTTQLENRIELIKKVNAKNILTYFAIMLTFAFGAWVLSGFETSMNRVGLLTIISCISVGVSEEVIFRLLPYSIIGGLSKGKPYPNVLAFILMTVPFVLLHFIEAINTNGFLHTLPSIFSAWLIASVPLTVVFVKRDLFTAMSVHFLYDMLVYVFATHV